MGDPNPVGMTWKFCRAALTHLYPPHYYASKANIITVRPLHHTMSYDLGVWYPHERLSDADAAKLYVGLCESTVESPRPHPAVDAFYQELTAKHPEIDTVPDDRIDDH